MKKIIIYLILVLLALPAASQPFAGRTKHHTVKRMTRSQVRKAQKGKTYYYRTNDGKLKKRK